MARRPSAPKKPAARRGGKRSARAARKAAPKATPKAAPPPPPKAARKPKRDYKAEYRRRIARAAAQGKTRQQARGHKAAEHRTRAQRAKAKYGVSPSTLTKLRQQARDRLVGLYQTVAKGPIKSSTIDRGMRLLHAEDLRSLIAADPVELVNYHTAAAEQSYGEQLAQLFPWSVEEIDNDDFRNPLWYK